MGVKRHSQLAENLAAPEIKLTPYEIQQLNEAVAPHNIPGDRSPAFVMKLTAQ